MNVASAALPVGLCFLGRETGGGTNSKNPKAGNMAVWLSGKGPFWEDDTQTVARPTQE